MSKEITRRDFLKGAAAISAASAVIAVFPPSVQLTRAKGKALAASTEWKANFCSGCHQPTCATLVKVQDGVVVAV